MTNDSLNPITLHEHVCQKIEEGMIGEYYPVSWATTSKIAKIAIAAMGDAGKSPVNGDEVRSSPTSDSLIEMLREKIEKIAYHSSQFLMHERGAVTAGICNRLAGEDEDILKAIGDAAIHKDVDVTGETLATTSAGQVTIISPGITSEISMIEILQRHLFGINYDLGLALKIQDDPALSKSLIKAAHKKCGEAFEIINSNSLKPVPVSLEKCARAITTLRYRAHEQANTQCESEYVHYMWTNWIAESKVVLDAAGVPYVD